MDKLDDCEIDQYLFSGELRAEPCDYRVSDPFEFEGPVLICLWKLNVSLVNSLVFAGCFRWLVLFSIALLRYTTYIYRSQKIHRTPYYDMHKLIFLLHSGRRRTEFRYLLLFDRRNAQ